MDETALYLDFFGDRKEQPKEEEKSGETKKDNSTLASQVVSAVITYYDSEFQSYLAILCSSLHRTVWRGEVTILDLDTLCQIVSVLGKERSMASSSTTTTAAARAISNVIEDAQQRLIFCATTALTNKVIRFKPTPANLNYRDRLRKKVEEDKPDDTEEDLVQKQMQV